ncbi:TldD/PmbA family protein [Aneurinibacillus aneurinilyticus]|uniref:TldD/PmbA family protein n=1 Tax=Aneurinibacillus aneurinilyticus ATCC 12856 TaxID=649747 RepID=U1WMS6_ANEAE|nr:TldD/PmbA family protein [Aneurinibacillus aneurinilyticus]ERI09889.1 TldD/PmbA family protein [Aneurinibacillus aneurinilyticus ATCC 12856]MED0706730.1 TldD/PmbA family protein [Aneurinibacillus aneurinilyticus]MED0725693.1 TldD/PmbA family protein [Aneurinibacillus aneurinilyticus]MED0734654.1 TldD/PmbA family protein [Aneurinibacillus aneurinilyticus]MED0739060.1 TldD/PmbA family protein [Aneurinibacillus aneurinilyticus]
MLHPATVERVLLAALSYGGDFAEVFVENKIEQNISMVKGEVEKARSGQDFGIGIRIFHGSDYLYTYTSNEDEEHLIKTARLLSQAAQKSEHRNKTITFQKRSFVPRHLAQIDPRVVSIHQKRDVLAELNHHAMAYHTAISQVRTRYFDETQKVLIANSEGVWAEDIRVRTRTFIEAIATEGNQKQRGYVAPGAQKGFEFYNELDLRALAESAADTAVRMLEAKPCPGGKMPVVIDNGFGGVIFHEACGHGMEATAVAKGKGPYAGKLGQTVVSAKISAVDDGTINNEWGSLNIDDEGTPAKRNVLIKKGILKGYLVDKLNGRRMGMESTGSSRRQSYRFAPTSRMTNTYILGGADKLEDMIATTEYGLYAKTMGGGSVNTTTGDFNFAVLEGYMIENGKLTYPVKGATLIGNGRQTMYDVDMVGNNFLPGQGMCGSISGSIPVNVGQPALRVSQLTVGGSGQ